MGEYSFRLLRVDLAAGTFRDERIEPETARAFLGGSGLAAAWISSLEVESIDPLRPANPLIWMTGPLVGTEMPSAGRTSVCALSPLTGIWGEANTGGFFGPELRFAGFDGLIVEGRSEGPVWLSIVEGVPELHEAIDLIGFDTYATQEEIRRRLGEDGARVACIGEAGERSVAFASILNDHGRAAGRCGLGAVMGSKNLKAVAVRGTASIRVADPKQFAGVVSGVAEATENDIAAQAIRMAGTAGYLDMAAMYGDLPVRSFGEGEWDGASELSGVRLTEEFLIRGRACYRCPIACGRETSAPNYGLERVDGPEYETLGALGSLLEISDLEGVIAAGHLCNTSGLDTISTGSTLALACELFERGLLTEAETGGIPIRYGDVETMLELIRRVARREGFGDALAEGSARLAARFGAPELAVTVNRLEVPMHDPRAFSGMAVSYALSPRGACHMQGDAYSVDTGQLVLEAADIAPGDRFESTEAKGRMAARTMIWRTVYNAINLCQFQNPGGDLVVEGLNAVTGWDLTLEDLMTAGRRILALKRTVNRRRGLSRADDTLPVALLRPLGSGGTQGMVVDLEALLSGAYAELGWSAETGMPTAETISRLGLDGVV